VLSIPTPSAASRAPLFAPEPAPKPAPAANQEATPAAEQPSCAAVDRSEPIFRGSDLEACIDLVHGARIHSLKFGAKQVPQYLEASYAMVGGGIDLDKPYAFAYKLPEGYAEMDDSTFAEEIIREIHPFLPRGPRGVPASNPVELKMWAQARGAAVGTHPDGFTWLSYDQFDSTTDTAANSADEAHRKEYINVLLGDPTSEDGLWMASCGFSEAGLLGDTDCISPYAHLYHHSDLSACMNSTQRTRQLYLRTGDAEAMRAFVQSSYEYEAGVIKPPYTFILLHPADLDISVDQLVSTTEVYLHPFLDSGPFNRTFPKDGGAYHLWSTMWHPAAKTKPEGSVNVSYTTDFSSGQAQRLGNDGDEDGGVDLDSILTSDFASQESVKLHRKNNLDVLLDGLDGTLYAGRRFRASCCYSELDYIGPTG